MGKTPPLLMGRRKVVFNVSSQRLEFLGGYDSPLANGQEKSRFQHLEPCTRVWVGKTRPFANEEQEILCNTRSHALHQGLGE